MCSDTALGGHSVDKTFDVVLGLAVHVAHHNDKGIGLAEKDAVGRVSDELFGFLPFPFGLVFYDLFAPYVG